MHRVIFKIIDENKKPVYDAWVSMNNSTTKYSTGKDGTTSNIEIASPANQFKVKVNADGFVSYNDYVIVPIVEVPKPITLTLIKGKVVSGYVKDTETKQPINKARVYTISGYNDDGAIEVETFTDEKGFYELRGISTPGKFLNPGGFKISNGTVTVYAVKSGEPAYIQQIQTAKGDNVTNINFELQRISCNSEIWGIPVEITSAERKGSRFLISGAFVKLPPNTTFKTWGNEKLPFKNVIVNIKKKRVKN
ncbi:MAG: carboxypeptidase-like regulatory domain-containing protein [Chitinophagaceae bacterium]